MQTVETTRQLCELDRELIKDVLQAFVNRRMDGDIEGMLVLLAPDVVVFPETTWRHARYSRKIVGKQAVREAFKQRHINYVIVRSVVHRTLIDGDQASLHRTTSIRERGSDVRHTFDSVDFFRFRDGLIVEFCELRDGSAYDAIINFPH